MGRQAERKGSKRCAALNIDDIRRSPWRLEVGRNTTVPVRHGEEGLQDRDVIVCVCVCATYTLAISVVGRIEWAPASSSS